jgi:hypothetical protein
MRIVFSVMFSAFKSFSGESLMFEGSMLKDNKLGMLSSGILESPRGGCVDIIIVLRRVLGLLVNLVKPFTDA